ncbi:class A beta-lactamase-related serine hydrolase [Synechococcus sp. HK05]|uniref:serine hydrolase n=1 Tax=Synechococcus sp. HK05 TaxID=2725975 RepID=UPI001C392E00|nr:serine hydrolase [Synechococcus sp. HK05]MBV2351371.1 class A beta-lactamase-related serine hydrolase [Synechococcus sp. HK05]
MAFYCPDGAMAQQLEATIAALEADGRPGLKNQLSITWLRYSDSLIDSASSRSDLEGFWADQPRGASWQGNQARYPASVVKLLYLVAAETWLQRQLIDDTPELRRALADMIRDSSNDATGLVLDLLTGTTSGPCLPEAAMASWALRRELVNQWCAQLGWSEWSGCNASQKTWGDGPYGRERQFYGVELENRNRLNTDLCARLLHAVMAGALVSPPACSRMRTLLHRSLDAAARAADPENQVDGFLGAGLPETARLWSKAGWMSQARHDAAYMEVEDCSPTLIVAFTEGTERAQDDTLLPELCRQLISPLGR